MVEGAKITSHEISPAFDLEDFMNFSRETRMESATLENILRLWEEWSGKLAIRAMENGGNSWLAIWLPEDVEKMVDSAWSESPGKGYLINSLAQYLCMTAIQEVLPQTAAGGCAPSPRPSPDLRAALEQAGLRYREQGASMLERRYAIVTYYPFKGGCEICDMRQDCPKGNGNRDFPSIVLPGYERGVAENGENGK